MSSPESPTVGPTPDQSTWPDRLQPPSPRRVEQLLHHFWSTLQSIGELLAKDELLLVNEKTHQLHKIVLEMMLALNGIQRPPDTEDMNGYLSADQRAAIEKTMILPSVEAGGWIGQAVSLVTIYRWYAPQLTDKFSLAYPLALEELVQAKLTQLLPDWPQGITTD